MTDENEKRKAKEQKKARIRRKYRVEVDPDNYEYIPAKKPIDYWDDDVNQRVGIYVRVSTGNVQQTTSYELQKKYYEDFVVRHPNWTLVDIYADEGISGTSLAHRDGFNRMLNDAYAGKLDLIITKSVSRFARNVELCISIVRKLSELKHPVNVFFETECISSMNQENSMSLTMLASFAEEESHIRSRSMEASLRMRLDNGIPLTPKLLGYTHDEEGNLVINPEEEPTVKLMFYMYLYGYSTQQIADTLIALGRRSYLGNIKWTANGVVQVLRNERHCGQVLTRKTWTPNFRDHKAKKNRGDRPQSRYSNHHEPIISRDDFIAVQQLLDNAKYRNKSVLPELRVIDSGLLRGFVTINPRWAGFKADDYLQAAMSAYESTDLASGLETPEEYTVEVAAGDFDLRGFEIARSEFFDPGRRPFVTFHDKKIKFSAACVRQFKSRNMIELLVNPLERKFAIRATGKDNRRAVQCSTWDGTDYYPRDIAAAAFSDTLYELFGWKTDYKYRIIGSLIEKDNGIVFLFNAARSEAYFDSYLLPVKDAAGTDGASVQPLLKSGRRIRAIPKEWATSFGQNFYYSEQSLSALEQQSEADWKLHIQGRLYDSGKQIKITGFDELHSYISQELKPLKEDAECRKE